MDSLIDRLSKDAEHCQSEHNRYFSPERGGENTIAVYLSAPELREIVVALKEKMDD